MCSVRARAESRTSQRVEHVSLALSHLLHAAVSVLVSYIDNDHASSVSLGALLGFVAATLRHSVRERSDFRDSSLPFRTALCIRFSEHLPLIDAPRHAHAAHSVERH